MTSSWTLALTITVSAVDNLSDNLVVLDSGTGQEIPHGQVLGTFNGVLSIGCFSAGIRLEGGPCLSFRHPSSVPKELMPERRGQDVPVVVKIILGEFGEVIYDAEKR